MASADVYWPAPASALDAATGNELGVDCHRFEPRPLAAASRLSLNMNEDSQSTSTSTNTSTTPATSNHRRTTSAVSVHHSRQRSLQMLSSPLSPQAPCLTLPLAPSYPAGSYSPPSSDDFLSVVEPLIASSYAEAARPSATLSLQAPFHYEQQGQFQQPVHEQLLTGAHRHVPSTRAYAFHPYGQTSNVARFHVPTTTAAAIPQWEEPISRLQHQHHHHQHVHNQHVYHSHSHQHQPQSQQIQVQPQQPQQHVVVPQHHQHVLPQQQYHAYPILQQPQHLHYGQQQAVPGAWNQLADFTAQFDFSNAYTISPTSLTVQPAQLCADPHSFGTHHHSTATTSSPITSEYASSIVPPSATSSSFSASSSSSSSSEPASPLSSKADSYSASPSVSPKQLVPPAPVTYCDSDSDDDHVPAPIKKRPAPNNKRKTRSAPEPAWVEAVISSSEDKPRKNNSNRPIAFACVFCRHRKIQCIRPKMDLAPGERPAPCNQCEKRSRTCEYPPAVLNPKSVANARRVKKNED